MLSAEKNGPCDAAGVLALEEEGFGLSILESEDLAITTNVELALFPTRQRMSPLSRSAARSSSGCFDVSNSGIVTSTSTSLSIVGDWKTVPFQGRSSRRRRYRRMCAYWRFVCRWSLIRRECFLWRCLTKSGVVRLGTRLEERNINLQPHDRDGITKQYIPAGRLWFTRNYKEMKTSLSAETLLFLEGSLWVLLWDEAQSRDNSLTASYSQLGLRNKNVALVPGYTHYDFQSRIQCRRVSSKLRRNGQNLDTTVPSKMHISTRNFPTGDA